MIDKRGILPPSPLFNASSDEGETTMQEASYKDAIVIGQQLNLNKDEVWNTVKGIRYTSITELSMAVYDAFKVYSRNIPPPGDKFPR